MDAEVIEVAWELMGSLGLRDVQLLVNSIGDSECRPRYIERLRNYYAGHDNRLCDDCRGKDGTQSPAST